jgi:hypothetical protein
LNIPTILVVVLVGLVPIVIFASLVIVPPNVKWQPPVIWQAGGPGITAVSIDRTGLYAIGGTFLMRYDLNGRQVWNKQLGDPNNVTFYGISVGTDGIYVSGIGLFPGSSPSISVIVEKHDMNGNKIWANKFENISSSQEISASTSGLYIAGLAPDSGPPALEPLIVRRYDSNGGILWTKILTNQTAGAQGGSVLVDADPNGVYLAGSDPWINDTTGTHAFLSRYDSNGNLVWKRPLDNLPRFKCACHPYSISGDATGIYLGGHTNDRSLPGETSFNYGGSFLRKYDPDGNVLWTTGDSGSWIAQISTNGLSVYSMENGLARYNAGNGNRAWIFPAYGNAIAAGESGVYLAEASGLLVSYSDSPSLVLFGINPPYSFIVVATIAGIIAFSILLKRKRARQILIRNYNSNEAKR